MIVKVFDFFLKLNEPASRTIRAVGRLYAFRENELTEIHGLARVFTPSEDALDFDLEFSDTLRLSVADVVHAVPRGEFDCRVMECEVRGRVLKVYDITENGSQTKLVLVLEQEDDKMVRRYAKRFTKEVQLSQLLESIRSEIKGSNVQ